MSTRELPEPDNTTERHVSTNYVWDTPLITVYAARFIENDRYVDDYRVNVFPKANLSEDDLANLIHALRST